MQWIGERPSHREISVALLLGITAVLILGLQPVLLGALAREGRLSASQIGFAATLELLMLGATAGIAAATLRPTRLRLIGALAALLHVAATVANIWSSGSEIILCRALTGLASGVMLWITISLITRSDRPERWSGLFLTLQTLVQLAFAAALSVLVIPRFGANGVLLALLAMSCLTGFAALTGPKAFGELPRAASGSTGGLSPRSLLGLLAVFVYMAFIVAVWVYFEPLGVQAGLSPRVAGLAIAAALGAQVLGGAVATVIGRRLPLVPVFAVAGVLNLCLLAVLASHPGTVVFMACAIVFGFLWLFVQPYQVPFLIDIDPSRRAAMQLATAQLLGGSAGPLVAAFVVSDVDVRGALGFGAACIVLNLCIVIGLRLRPWKSGLAVEQTGSGR